jgi:sulfur carrier protein
VRVELNGESVELPAGATVSDALAAAGIGAEARGVAVAVGGEVVSRSEWATRALAEGESVEVVQAVQGG